MEETHRLGTSAESECREWDLVFLGLGGGCAPLPLGIQGTQEERVTSGVPGIQLGLAASPPPDQSAMGPTESASNTVVLLLRPRAGT